MMKRQQMVLSSSLIPYFNQNDTSIPIIIRARKLVVVSAGACGSPLILERSGVGNSEILRQASVHVVADMPGVGHDYQDHNGVFPVYKTSLELHQTNNALLGGVHTLDQAIENGDPNVRWNMVDVAAKIRPREADIAALGCQFQAAWEKDFRNELVCYLLCLCIQHLYVQGQKIVSTGRNTKQT